MSLGGKGVLDRCYRCWAETSEIQFPLIFCVCRVVILRAVTLVGLSMQNLKQNDEQIKLSNVPPKTQDATILTDVEMEAVAEVETAVVAVIAVVDGRFAQQDEKL